MRIEELKEQTEALAMKIQNHCGKELKDGQDTKTSNSGKTYQDSLNKEIQSIESMKSKLDKKRQ